jgi:hypothetical protein
MIFDANVIIIVVVILIGIYIYISRYQTGGCAQTAGCGCQTAGCAQTAGCGCQTAGNQPTQVNILERALEGLIQGGGAPISASVDALGPPVKPKQKYIRNDELIAFKTTTGEELTLNNGIIKVTKDGLGNELFKLRLNQTNRVRRIKPRITSNLKLKSNLKSNLKSKSGLTTNLKSNLANLKTNLKQNINIKFDVPVEINYTNPVSGLTKRIWIGDELKASNKSASNKNASNKNASNKNASNKNAQLETKFVLISKQDPLSVGSVPHDAEVLIKTSKGYLVADGDKVKTNGSVTNATSWIIKHQKGCGPLWRFKR